MGVLSKYIIVYMLMSVRNAKIEKATMCKNNIIVDDCIYMLIKGHPTKYTAILDFRNVLSFLVFIYKCIMYFSYM